MVEEEQNRQNEIGRSEGGDSQEVTQKVLIWNLILDDRTENVINSMNNMKSSFTLKRSWKE